MKRKSEKLPNKKDKSFRENIVVIEGDWFSGMNLTVRSTLLTALIKRKN